MDVSGHLTILGNRPHGLLSEIRALVDNSVQNMRLFKLDSSSTLGKSLTLKRIKLTGGYGSMDGGQIFLKKAQLDATSVWFAGSFERQAAKRGGSIYATASSKLDISDSAATRFVVEDRGGFVYHYDCQEYTFRLHNTIVAGILSEYGAIHTGELSCFCVALTPVCPSHFLIFLFFCFQYII